MKTNIKIIAAVLAVNLGSAITASADKPTAGRLSDEPSECRKVLERAQQLPSPTPRSIYNYGSDVIKQGGRCLDKARREVFSK